MSSKFENPPLKTADGMGNLKKVPPSPMVTALSFAVCATLTSVAVQMDVRHDHGCRMFPDRLRKFPVLVQMLPVPMRREYGYKAFFSPRALDHSRG